MIYALKVSYMKPIRDGMSQGSAQKLVKSQGLDKA